MLCKHMSDLIACSSRAANIHPVQTANHLLKITHHIPINDRSAFKEEIACMTLVLPPSITGSENPSSIVNSIAFLHASISASSLHCTARPLANTAAITSPLSFLITAPNPDLSKPVNNTICILINITITKILNTCHVALFSQMHTYHKRNIHITYFVYIILYL